MGGDEHGPLPGADGVLSYDCGCPICRVGRWVAGHKLSLKQHGLVRQYHIIFFSILLFGVGMFMLGKEFTMGAIAARLLDALGDVLLDRGVGEL